MIERMRSADTRLLIVRACRGITSGKIVRAFGLEEDIRKTSLASQLMLCGAYKATYVIESEDCSSLSMLFSASWTYCSRTGSKSRLKSQLAISVVLAWKFAAFVIARVASSTMLRRSSRAETAVLCDVMCLDNY